LQKVFHRVRRIDEIGWYGQNRIGIILPYTSAQGAQKFAESLCNSFSLTTKECLLNIYTYDSDQTNTAQANKGNI
jgi:PleD family two-component response regulator